RPSVEPWRRSSLQSRPLETKGAELLAQQLGGGFAVSTASITILPNVRQSVQEGAGRDDHNTRGDRATVAQQHPGDAPAVAPQSAFCNATDRGVAGRLRNQMDIQGDHRGPEPHSRAGPGGLAPGVSGADNDGVVGVVHCYHCSQPMKILVIGSGGREHALAWKL